jgi:hypothetical protein
MLEYSNHMNLHAGRTCLQVLGLKSGTLKYITIVLHLNLQQTGLPKPDCHAGQACLQVLGL